MRLSQALAITRRISRTMYARHCIEEAAVQAYLDAGMEIVPGMKISYMVRDARTYRVDSEWAAEWFDLPHYRGLLDRAWKEISCAFQGERHKTRRECES